MGSLMCHLKDAFLKIRQPGHQYMHLAECYFIYVLQILKCVCFSLLQLPHLEFGATPATHVTAPPLQAAKQVTSRVLHVIYCRGNSWHEAHETCAWTPVRTGQNFSHHFLKLNPRGGSFQPSCTHPDKSEKHLGIPQTLGRRHQVYLVILVL